MSPNAYKTKVHNDVPNKKDDLKFIYFQRFIKNFGKTYNNIEEYKRRYRIFEETYDLLQKANKLVPNADPPFALNTFADRMRHERESYYEGFIYTA